MNDEQRQELASLHVLGLLTGDEAAAFARALESDAELRDLVFTLNESLHLLAGSVPRFTPPPELRAEVLKSFAALEAPEKPAAVPPAPFRAVLSDPPEETRGTVGSRLLLFIPWAAAAAFALLFLQQFSEREALEKREETARQTLSRQEAILQAADLQRTESETARQSAESTLETVRRQLTDLTANRAALVAEIESLKAAGSFDKTRISLLSSQLKARPNAVAATVWNQTQQDGLLVVENLPALARGRDYQLWVIDSSRGTPVSAGVFKVDEKGNVRIQFKPDQPVGTADKFAVTIEKEGGSPVPTLTQLVVIGG